MKYALLLHLLGTIVWIGGMFFAYMVLRPAASLLEPPQRLELWREALRRFFVWVWLAVLVIFASGVYMSSIAYGMRAPPGYVLAMTGIAAVMVAIYCYIFFVGFRRLDSAVNARHWKDAAGALGRIRELVATNLVLGLLAVTVAVIGGLLG